MGDKVTGPDSLHTFVFAEFQLEVGDNKEGSGAPSFYSLASVKNLCSRGHIQW